MKVKINGSGSPFYLASDGKFYSEKMIAKPSSTFYEADLANFTHIPIND